MVKIEYPDKLYYTISEVKDIADVEVHVLRYWETVFPTLKPKRNVKGQRMYQKKDIKLILKIKDLLYKKKYTIKGAISALKGKNTAVEKDGDDKSLLLKVHHELKSLLKSLDGEKRDDLFDN